MPLPQDYVHYVKLSWVDNAGIHHTIYPSSKTSNPTSYQQETNGNLRFETNTWKVNITGDDFEGRYVEYGITRSYDSFGNPISSANDFVSKSPLPQFASEVRFTINKVLNIFAIDFFTIGHNL